MSSSVLSRNQLVDLDELLKHASAVASAPPVGGRTYKQGNFFDVTKVNHTKLNDGNLQPSSSTRWTLQEQALYMAWWSHRPTYCRSCGQHDSWTPCSEEEYKCGRCLIGAGTTKSSDVIEDYGGADDDDGSDGDDYHNNQASAAESNIVRLFTVFLEKMAFLRAELGNSGMLPSYKRLPGLFRAASDIFMLLSIPSSAAAANVLHEGSLYVALLVSSHLVPFVSFTSAMTAGAHKSAVSASSRPNGTAATSMDAASVVVVPTEQHNATVLTWMDVHTIARILHIQLPDMFATREAMSAFLINAATLLMEFSVPSILWRVDRAEGRAEKIILLSKKISGASSGAKQHQQHANTQHAKTHVVGQLSTEHIAICVMLELTRDYQASALKARESSNHAASISEASHSSGVDEFQDGGDTSGRNEAALPEHLSPENVTRVIEWAKHWHSIANTCLSMSPTHHPAPQVSPAVVRLAASLHAFPTVLPDSTWANLLLHMASALLQMHVLELAEQLLQSHMYNQDYYRSSGVSSIRFLSNLSESVSKGVYVLPLHRPLFSSILSPWQAAYFALHSENRLPLLAALHRITSGRVAKDAPACKMVQKIIRQHATQKVQFNYGMRVNDPKKEHMNGLYFCSFVSSTRAVYTCLRSAKKTVCYNSEDQSISLCFVDAKEERVANLQAHFIGPVIADVESPAAKMLLDCARFALGSDEWASVVRILSARVQVSKLMRISNVPGTTALSFARDALARASTHAVDNAAIISQNAGTVFSTPALLKETSLEVLGLVSSTLLSGLSDSRVCGLYSSAVAVAEDAACALQLDKLPSGEGKWSASEAGRREAVAHALALPASRKRFRLDDADTCRLHLQRFHSVFRSSLVSSGGMRLPAKDDSIGDVLAGLGTGVVGLASNAKEGHDKRAERYSSRISTQTFPI